MYSTKAKQLIDIGANVWTKLLDELHEEFGEAVFKGWFVHLTFQELKDDTIVITAPSRFIKEWIANNYLKYISKKVSEINPTITYVDLRVKPTRSKISGPKCVINDNYEKIIEDEHKCDILSSHLNPRFTFENFVVGTSNKIAHGAAKSVAEHKKLPGDNNILYLHSSVGLGKTHLLQAITSYMREHKPKAKVAYLSAEKFMHLYIKSVKNNDVVTFKEKLRSADVLLVDDLQFICGKTGTQQEFTNIMNSLTDSNKIVVISSDVSPFNLNIDPRSKSRIAGGLVVEIKNSDYDLRLSILKNKVAQMEEANVSDDVLKLIADKISSSNRELEGALNKIITHATLSGETVSVELATNLIHDNISAHEREISIEQIIEFVSAEYGIKSSEMLSKSRAAKFVLPRQIAAYLAKQLTKKSLQEIGQKLGNRDHATVIYSVSKLETLLQTDKELGNTLAKFLEKLGRK